MLPFDYYWRIEPDVEYSCDLDFDPFLYMQDNNKKYGNHTSPEIDETEALDRHLPCTNSSVLENNIAFTMSLPEYMATIPTLWNVTRDFMAKYPHLLADNNSLDFISNDGGETYNVCK